MMRTMAVIPVKPMDRALGRLATVLTRPERRDLQAAMLTDLLGACRDLTDRLVVTSDPGAADLARAHGATVVPDHHPPRGINPAVGIGQAHAAGLGIDRVLVLTADLPLATTEDLAAIIAASTPGPGVVIVPSRDGSGTHALLINPPTVITTHLGPDSRAQHHAAVAAAGVPHTELALPWVGLDIDTPEDLGLLLAAPRPSRARDVCLAIGVGERLTAGTVS